MITRERGGEREEGEGRGRGVGRGTWPQSARTSAGSYKETGSAQGVSGHVYSGSAAPAPLQDEHGRNCRARGCDGEEEGGRETGRQMVGSEERALDPGSSGALRRSCLAGAPGDDKAAAALRAVRLVLAAIIPLPVAVRGPRVTAHAGSRGPVSRLIGLVGSLRNQHHGLQGLLHGLFPGRRHLLRAGMRTLPENSPAGAPLGMQKASAHATIRLVFAAEVTA